MLPAEIDILQLIPQRPPVVMVNKLLSCDEKGATSEFLIEENNVFCMDGVFTEAGIIENIAQTAASHVGYICKTKNIPVPIGFIGAVKNLEVYSFPASGSKIRSSIQIENEVFGVTLISGKVLQGDKLMASAEMKIVIKT